MKRIITCCAAMLLALLLAACAGGTESAWEDQGGSEMPVESSEEAKTSEYSVEEVSFERDGLHIYGKLYLPSSEEAHPLVVLSHGFGGNSGHLQPYAELFAENGIAACAFDFIGGGSVSKSDGATTEMSVLTEAADLNAVIDGLAVREDVDASELYLVGGSQGGFVSTYVAATRPDDIKALVAFYPAYVIHDDAWSRTPDPDNIPETMNLMGVTIGRVYNEDAMSFDIYDLMKDYPGDVLIIHGTNDSIAPISYSRRAEDVFPSAELVEFDGAGHGFYGDDEARSAQMAIDFVKRHLGKSGESGAEGERAELELTLTIAGETLDVSWEDNDSVAALRDLAKDKPLEVQMSMYGGFEQVGSLGADLPRSDEQTTTQAGDIVLYQGNQIVVFYGSNSWTYTRLGHIEGKTAEELEQLLGERDVTLTLEVT